MSPLRLAIVDDHRMFLDGLVAMLAEEPDLAVAFTTATAQAAIDVLADGGEVDLVVTDVNMEPLDGVALNAWIKRERPGVRTLAVSMRHDAHTVRALTEAGVDGYLPKDADRVELLRAIRAIGRGERYFAQQIQDAYLASTFGRGGQSRDEVALTRREREVLTLIAAERTTQEIADELFLSRHTIEGYRKSLIAKLDVRNLAGLVKEAVRRGLA